MTSEWNHSTINDVCVLVTDGSHSSPKSVNDGKYMVSVKDFTDYGFDFASCRMISNDDYETLKRNGCVPQIDDILIGKDGARFFEDIIIYRQREKPALLSSIAILRCDKSKILPDFLYYVLRTPSFRQDVKDNYGSGSAIPRIILKDFKRMMVSYPSLEKQQAIISVLTAIDSKIQANTEINDNLYAQAKATTKQWISKSTGDYELLPLSDIASINPDTYSPKETWKYVNYLDTSSITEGCIAEIQHITPSSEKLPSRARRKIAPNDIVFSTVRPNQRHYGIISEPLPNMLGSTGFAVIRSKNPLVCNELIYLCLTENEFIEKMQQLAEQSTSTFPSIKPSDLGVCEIPCPKDQSSTSFTETLKSLFALIAANQRENISLSEIRDALLPKLMSGEIDVSDIQL